MEDPLTDRELQALRTMIENWHYMERRAKDRKAWYGDSKTVLLVLVAVVTVLIQVWQLYLLKNQTAPPARAALVAASTYRGVH